MGIKGSSTRQVFFNDCKVPVENMLSERQNGFKIAVNILNIGRIKLAGAALGGAKAVVDQSVKYANERIQFGKPISAFGAIRQKLADQATYCYVVESATYRCSQDMEHAIEALGTPSRLGIGWEHKPAFLTAKDTLQAVVAFVVWLVGVVAAAFAASLGGDFWFKWIGDIVRLTGYKPVRKVEPPPADPQTVAVIERLLKVR